MRTTLLFSVLLALMVVGGMQIASLRRTNMTLRAQVNQLRVAREQRTTNSEQWSPANAAGADLRPAPIAAMNEAPARLTRLRAEVAKLEKNAAEHYARNPEETDAPSRNRDPEQGMTRLEYLRNVGQRTPAQALQTLFWAALKGDDQVLARTVAWDPTVRPQVQALIERLPAESRARYPTPEQLWGLIISKYALDVSAIHIAETVPKDTTNASLTVKGLTASDVHLDMGLGPNGWQLRVGEWHLKMVSNELTGAKGN